MVSVGILSVSQRTEYFKEVIGVQHLNNFSNQYIKHIFLIGPLKTILPSSVKVNACYSNDDNNQDG